MDALLGWLLVLVFLAFFVGFILLMVGAAKGGFRAGRLLRHHDAKARREQEQWRREDSREP